MNKRDACARRECVVLWCAILSEQHPHKCLRVCPAFYALMLALVALAAGHTLTLTLCPVCASARVPGGNALAWHSSAAACSRHCQAALQNLSIERKLHIQLLSPKKKDAVGKESTPTGNCYRLSCFITPLGKKKKHSRLSHLPLRAKCHQSKSAVPSTH